MKKNFILLALLALVSTFAFAQTAQITGVSKKEFRGVKPILNKGYYTFYVNEKASKGMVEFMLEIYDLDLKMIKKTPILITKNSAMIGGEFNGRDFLFAFSDPVKKQNTFASIDMDGNIIKQEVRQNKKMATAGTTQIFPSMDGEGFFVTQLVKEKKWGYSVEKLDRNLSALWEKTTSNDKGIVMIEAAEAGNGKLVLVTAERPSMLSNKVFGKIVCIDGGTGKLQYEQPLYDGQRTGIPSAIMIDSEGNVVTAGMYFDGEKWDATNSDGVFFMKLSSAGKKLMYNHVDWDKGIQDKLKATSRKFAIGSKPKVLFHEIIEAGNDGYQVIAETFRKTMKAGTMLAMAGGGNSSDVPWGFTVMDYVIFNYDKNGEPNYIDKIEKPYKSGYVPGSIANMGGVSLAYYMKKYKMFTYEFTTKLKDTDKQVIVYTNFEDAGLGNGTPYIGVSTLQMGKESVTNKMPLSKKLAKFTTGGNPEDMRTGAIQSKPGYVCMYYYDKKTETINLALEELKL